MSQAHRGFAAARSTATGTRENNQDRSFFLHDGTTILLGVADGLGGHPRGEVAAQLFVDVCETQFRRSTRPLESPEDFMLHCIGRAHQAIRRFGERQQPPITPRTTAVMAVVQGDQARWAHVGDSRLYLYRDEQLLLQTRDHSQTQYTRQTVDEHPRARTSLTRCLGGLPRPPTTTCSTALALQPGDALLLCSDGLWSQTAEPQLAELFDGDPALLESRLQRTVAQAAATAASDNVTAVALTWLGQPTQDCRQPRPAAPDQASNSDLNNKE